MPACSPLPKWPTLNLEREHSGPVCGVDEVGYAPLAGPVVAAAVVLPDGPKPRKLRGLTDSKLLAADARERYADAVMSIGLVSIGVASVEEIDRLNIYRANLLAMQRAVAGLGNPPDTALVDGRALPALPCETRAVVKGDRRSLSIAAASVVAKVYRDRLMSGLAAGNPGYGWQRNAGYGTPEHYLGLLRFGVTEHHRRSFAPIATLFDPDGAPRQAFRFEPVNGAADGATLELLELRQDLRVVFDGRRRHVGQIRNLRGRWTFLATGYDANREAVPGGGPLAPCHGKRMTEPDVRALRQLMKAAQPGMLD